jgi:hypothetical protein
MFLLVIDLVGWGDERSNRPYGTGDRKIRALSAELDDYQNIVL